MSDPIKDQWKIVRYGTDSIGRPIYMTWYHRRWFVGRRNALGLDLRPNQGSFMSKVAGGGANASSDFHDLAGCVDLSTRNLTDAQKLAVVWHFRNEGAGTWIRDESDAHGNMPEHIHYVLGVDRPMTGSARLQWVNYAEHNDAGLAGSGRDYHRRPSPMVTVPSTPPYAGTFTKGSTGRKVKAIQRGLRRAGYKSVEVDGKFGEVTAKALRLWKLRQGWAPTNTVGSRCYWRLTPR